MNRSEERILKNKKLKKRRKRVKRIFLFLIILFALFFGLRKLGIFNIKEVYVKGPKGVPVNEIIKQSGLKTGVNYFSVSKRKRIASIDRIPNIKNVKISFSPSRIVTISVDMRIPKAQIIGKSKNYIIDDEFKVIDISKNEEENLMRVEGLRTDKFALGKVILPENNDQRKLMTKLFNDKEVYDTIYSLVVSKYEAVFYTKDDIKVDLGTYTDLDYKFKMLGLIIKDIEDTGKEVSSIEMEKGPDPIVIGKSDEEKNDSKKESENKDSHKNKKEEKYSKDIKEANKEKRKSEDKKSSEEESDIKDSKEKSKDDNKKDNKSTKTKKASKKKDTEKNSDSKNKDSEDNKN